MDFNSNFELSFSPLKTQKKLGHPLGCPLSCNQKNHDTYSIQIFPFEVIEVNCLIRKGCFRILCCYSPSNAVWVISPPMLAFRGAGGEPPRRERLWGLTCPAAPAGVSHFRSNQR